RTANAKLLEREVHRHRHDDRHWHAIERRGRVDPLLDRVERRRVEQRNRAKHFRVLDGAVGPDGGFDNHDALYARRLCDRGIDRVDLLDLRRGLDVATDPDWSRRRRRRRRRWWRRFGKTADDAAGNAADDAAFDALGGGLHAALEPGLRLDFLRRLDGGR